MFTVKKNKTIGIIFDQLLKERQFNILSYNVNMKYHGTGKFIFK